MSAKRGQGGTLGIAIAIAAVLVVLLVLAVTQVRLPKPDAPKPTKPVTSVDLTGLDSKNGGAAMRAQFEIYDNKPLFRPTPINSSDPAIPAALRREPGNAFKTILPQLTFAEYEMAIALPEPISVPKTLVEVLSTGETANPFFTFGRINYPYTPLRKRLAFIEVLQAKTGRIVLAEPLDVGLDAPPAADWQPLEMMIAVEPTGLIGAPTVTKGSEFEEIDNYFRAFIGKQVRLGARLQPGFYILRIGQ